VCRATIIRHFTALTALGFCSPIFQKEAIIATHQPPLHRLIMNTKIDIKSALIGLGIGVLVTVGIAAGSASGTVGRYQIAGTASHGLVIDTATGQV
jgi:hypothetical protein